MVCRRSRCPRRSMDIRWYGRVARHPRHDMPFPLPTISATLFGGFFFLKIFFLLTITWVKWSQSRRAGCRVPQPRAIRHRARSAVDPHDIPNFPRRYIARLRSVFFALRLWRGFFSPPNWFLRMSGIFNASCKAIELRLPLASALLKNPRPFAALILESFFFPPQCGPALARSLRRLLAAVFRSFIAIGGL